MTSSDVCDRLFRMQNNDFFIGRAHELEWLEGLWSKPTASLVVCAGRRRIGKSTLIAKFAERSRCKFIEISGLAPDEGVTDNMQRKNFCESLAEQTGRPEVLADTWPKAFAALADAITSIGKEYEVNPGDGAFYGPKLDFHIQDSLGRTWQCGTIQLDYQLPGRFDLEYVGADGEKHCPVMIHRVVFGSIERFIGVITEHFAGAFPTWLSPVQVKVLTITNRTDDYANDVVAKLEAAGVRVEKDLRNESLRYKIREAQMQKIPYMLTIGDKEAAARTVAVRTRAGKDLGAVPFDEFLEGLKKEISERN